MTINDIAAMTGLSKSTVSRALNSRPGVSTAARTRIDDALSQSGFVPARSARALSTGRTGLIALLVGENRDPNVLTFISGAVGVADQSDLHVVVGVSASERNNYDVYQQLLASRVVDGAILVWPPTGDQEVISKFVEQRFPLVAIEPQKPFPGVPAVYADARHDGLIVTEHLVDRGHRRIAIALNAPGWGEQDRLLEGYRAGHRRAGFAVDPALIRRDGWSFEAGGAAVASWARMKNPPTALMFNSDFAAMGAVSAIPDEWPAGAQRPAVVGYDDTEILGWMNPPITAPLDRRATLARAAAEILVDILASRPVRDVTRLRTSLTVRGSSAKNVDVS